MPDKDKNNRLQCPSLAIVRSTGFCCRAYFVSVKCVRQSHYLNFRQSDSPLWRTLGSYWGKPTVRISWVSPEVEHSFMLQFFSLRTVMWCWSFVQLLFQVFWQPELSVDNRCPWRIARQNTLRGLQQERGVLHRLHFSVRWYVMWLHQTLSLEMCLSPCQPKRQAFVLVNRHFVDELISVTIFLLWRPGYPGWRQSHSDELWLEVRGNQHQAAGRLRFQLQQIAGRPGHNRRLSAWL